MENNLGLTAEPCRLCGQIKPLLLSHIIPNFCFKSLRDIKGRLTQLSTIDNKDVCFSRGGRGICERMLCAECETRFSKFETHAAKLFRGPLPPLVPPSRRVRQYPMLDYKKLKLFFLSVLWRSSVASDEFFRLVDLGPHEEVLSGMLLREDPGLAETYATLLFLLNHGGEHLRELMTEPTPAMHEQRRHYRLVMAGFVIIIYASKMPPTRQFLQLAIGPNKPIMSCDAELREFGFLESVPDRIAVAMPM